MADKTFREFSVPTTANIRTGSNINVGDNEFELKPALINMVQASQFCGKAHEDASVGQSSWVLRKERRTSSLTRTPRM
jgi:hypothetical protein